MESLTKKTLKVSRSFIYTYYVSVAKSSLPTVLLLHGFPDSAELWSHLITTYLQPAGYGVVAIDDLGHAGSSKPTVAAAYALDVMAKDLCEILDAEELDRVISLGHDWGSGLAQRLYNFHPDRVRGLVVMNVAYIPMSGRSMDVDQMNEMMTKMIGYGPYWYWHLFTSDEGPKILDAHVESAFTALHGDPATWMETLCKKDGLKNYLLEDRKQAVLPYATTEMRESFIKRMSRDSFTGPLLWYNAMIEGLNLEAEKKVLNETNVVKVPTLFIAATKDPVCLPGAIEQPVQLGLLPDLTVEEIDAGHWCMLAKPTEVGEALTKWLKNKF